MSLLGNPKTTKSSIELTLSHDPKTHDILKEVLTQLKINNKYLLQIVGDANEICESDIEIKEQ